MCSPLRKPPDQTCCCNRHNLLPPLSKTEARNSFSPHTLKHVETCPRRDLSWDCRTATPDPAGTPGRNTRQSGSPRPVASGRWQRRTDQSAVSAEFGPVRPAQTDRFGGSVVGSKTTGHLSPKGRHPRKHFHRRYLDPMESIWAEPRDACGTRRGLELLGSSSALEDAKLLQPGFGAERC